MSGSFRTDYHIDFTGSMTGTADLSSGSAQLIILQYNIGEAAGHNDTQSIVSDVHITSLTEHPTEEIAELNAPCLSILISQQSPVTVRVVINGMICESQRHIEMTVGYDRYPNNL